MSTVWRKKKCRTIAIDYDSLSCTCFGPLSLTKKERKECERVVLQPDEFQTIVYQDIEKLTMAEWCKKMGISKTVYAWLYEKAREKIACALLENHILTLACPE